MELTLETLVWILFPTLATILITSTMGLFGGNKMPVDGKVTYSNVVNDAVPQC